VDSNYVRNSDWTYSPFILPNVGCVHLWVRVRPLSVSGACRLTGVALLYDFAELDERLAEQ